MNYQSVIKRITRKYRIRTADIVSNDESKTN